MMRTRSERTPKPARAGLTPLSGQTMQEAPGRVTQSKLLLTPQEVADVLGISRSGLYTLIRRGEISSLTIGRRRYFSPAAIEEWIANQLAA